MDKGAIYVKKLSLGSQGNFSKKKKLVFCPVNTQGNLST